MRANGKVLIPGSWPKDKAKTPQEAMMAMEKMFPGRLLTLSDGEVRPEQDRWIVDLIRRIRRVNNLPLHDREGMLDGWRYLHLVRWAFRFLLRGPRKRQVVTLPDLGFAQYVHDSFPEFLRLQKAGGPEYFQVGIPSPLAIALLSGLPRHIDQVVGAVIAEVNEILADPTIDNDKLVWQFELPVEMALIVVTVGDPMVMRWALKSVGRVMEALPEATKVAAHNCTGDLNNRALLRWLNPLWIHVRMLNTFLVLASDMDCEVLYVHQPLGGGRKLPTCNRWRLRALRRLRVLDSAYVMLGVGHWRQTTERADRVFERAVRQLPAGAVPGRSPQCGLGRHTLEQALAVCAQL